MLIYPFFLISIIMHIDNLQGKKYDMILTGGLLQAKEPWIFLTAVIPIAGAIPLSILAYNKLKSINKL